MFRSQTTKAKKQLFEAARMSKCMFERKKMKIDQFLILGVGLGVKTYVFCYVLAILPENPKNDGNIKPLMVLSNFRLFHPCGRCHFELM